MTQSLLEILSDRLTDAHTRIQQDYQTINPIIGLSRKMRDIGFPSDTFIIDCLKTRRRIILILHDEQPDIVSYQFSEMDKDPSEKFESVPFDQLTTQAIYDWIVGYFSKTD